MTDQTKKPKFFDSSPIPLYVQLADIIRYRIERQLWPEGTMLPTIDTLMDEFSVSRVTVRHAMQLLSSSGLIEIQRGVGTFVLKNHTRRNPVKVETTLDGLIEAYRNDKPLLTYISDSSEPLCLTEDDGIPAPSYQHLRRVHTRDDVKYCVISIYLDERIFKMAEERFRTEVILPVLASLDDVTVANAKQSITISKADLETSRLLDLPLGDPVAHVRRVLTASDGTIIYVAGVTYRGDYIHLEMDLKK
ncbi:GntR family transcriptional regulator [Halomonas cupida]|uniref:GntR family transcriptional regulator n=1 Tax=Halomonas cupida TaxID=44933 RepID=A0A1M7DXS3_9GAMM|nr:GntR family transcriptional regulator [Halomonas cupida]GEN22933.1 GntR family transcriptional regulator [Halomonas cupida]SHL84246.1 GntR family transcriptional regulator [Halomonas cupida]